MAGKLSEAAGGAMTPQLAQAAAQAGAPPPGAETQAGAPPPGAETQAGAPAPVPAGGAPSPAAAAPPPQVGAQAGAQASNPLLSQRTDYGAAIQPYLREADPQQQQEYERAMRALAKVLYANDATANAIVDQIGENVVSDTAKVTMLFIKELDKKINMDEAVIAEVTREAVERIAELAEARHGIEYQPTDIEKIIGATWEGVQMMFGNEDVAGFTQTVQNIRNQDLQAIKELQESILGQAGE